MALKKKYYSVSGQLIGERPKTQTRTNFATDAQGSVTGTLESGALRNIYFYKPYGALLGKSGSGVDPAFQWVGSLGYRATGRSYSDAYVRARTFATSTMRWSTRDPQWPNDDAYAYVCGAPVSKADATGLGPPRKYECTKPEKKECKAFCVALFGKGSVWTCLKITYAWPIWDPDPKPFYSYHICGCPGHDFADIVYRALRKFRGSPLCNALCEAGCGGLPGMDGPSCKIACDFICGSKVPG